MSSINEELQATREELQKQTEEKPFDIALVKKLVADRTLLTRDGSRSQGE